MLRLPTFAVWLMTVHFSCASMAEHNGLRWSQLPSFPDALGVAGPYAGVSDGVLLVAGGANFPEKMPWEGGRKVWHGAVYALRQPSGRWELAGQLPRPLAYGISVSTSIGVVCAGGSDADRHYPDVLFLTFTNDTLQTYPLPKLPRPLANAAGAVVGSTWYIAGGSERPGEQAALNSCLAFSFDNPEAGWREIEPCPGKPRILPVAGSLADDFFLMGGAALEPAEGKVARVYLRDAWRYRAGRGWQRLADLPQACVAGPGPVPVWNGKLLLMGGDDGLRSRFQPVEKHPGFSDAVWAYDPARDHWEKAGQSPAPRVTAPVVLWRGRYVIPSGEVRPGVRSPEVWSLRAEGWP